jgi:hypothetical protein
MDKCFGPLLSIIALRADTGAKERTYLFLFILSTDIYTNPAPFYTEWRSRFAGFAIKNALETESGA